LSRVVVLAGGSVSYAGPAPRLRDNVVREKDTSGLGVVKFFDPARLGVEVVEGKDGVRVKKAAKDKAFAAVLRPGDMVTAVGSARVCSVEAFRARLRAALAEGTRSIALTVRRDGKDRAVRVLVRR
jgi:S1-C subfamily serine protease